MVEDNRRPKAQEIEVVPQSPAIKAFNLMFASPDYMKTVERLNNNPDRSEDSEAFRKGVIFVNRPEGVRYSFHERILSKQIIRVSGEEGYEEYIDVVVGKNGEMRMDSIDYRPNNPIRITAAPENTERELMEFAMRFFEGSEDRKGRMPYDRDTSPEFQFSMMARDVVGSRFASRFGYRALTGLVKTDKGWDVMIAPTDPVDEADKEKIADGLGINVIFDVSRGIIRAQ